MADPLFTYIRRTLPDEVAESLNERLDDLEQGRYSKLLLLPEVRFLLGDDNGRGTETIALSGDWSEYISQRYAQLQAHSEDQKANVTGPPLGFSSADLILPKEIFPVQLEVGELRNRLKASLTIDGEAVYKLTPNVELLCLSNVILTNLTTHDVSGTLIWARLRTQFMLQRLLSSPSPTLQKALYDGLDKLDGLLGVQAETSEFDDMIPSYLLEKAAIHTHHGFDAKAREVLDDCAKRRKFTFALTGLLGKRTKYQERDTSQLVVLARSNEDASATQDENGTRGHADAMEPGSKPQALALDDDTLLEDISFTKQPSFAPNILPASDLPTALSSLDPSNQPLLDPLDSIVLLTLAASITNTRPTDGLTREETLPYAQRVLSGGSSNWQIYTQALLIRSRIEGHRSRTTERGLLQLQALVDQVISETTDSADQERNDKESIPAFAINDKPAIESASTFLPRAPSSESAPAFERLLYIHSLASPTRWELEAELAARWVSLGGLRSALEIYERLEMWAEAALCWAGTDREDKARKIVRSLLFQRSASNGEDGSSDPMKEPDSHDDYNGPPRSPPPADAPRLYCILGDLDNDVHMYELAWDVSGGKYARAQRSIGRYWYSRSVSGGDAKDCVLKAASAYSKSIKINQLHGPSWFALGCALLELQDFERAAEAFARVVQLDETDAESWSNLATSLLKKGPGDSNGIAKVALDDDDEEGSNDAAATDPQQHIRSALRALRRAASLKHDSARIWDNLITVAFSLNPPSWSDILTAQRRVIAIRGPTEGEVCIDADVLEALTREVTAINYFATDDGGKRIINPEVTRGTPRLFIELLEDHVTPLITSSPRLWRVLSTVALWRARPSEALEALEKGWRAALANAGWEDGDQKGWDRVVEATIELVDGYESLGERQKESLSDHPATADELVSKDWKFKARSAIRSVTGKAKSAWEDSEGYERLRERLDELKK